MTERTGLTAHVIRIWEKRYAAVVPERTATNRRLYSDEQIDRLNLLRRLADQGHAIGHVAKLPTDRLQKLLAPDADSAALAGPSAQGGGRAMAAFPLLASALQAVEALDVQALEKVLDRAEVALGGQGVLQRLVSPLMEAIGERWREGTLTAAHEHFATAAVRLFLSHAARPFAGSANAPVLLVVTPPGQLHELGALLAAAAATNLGWHVTYLGPSLAVADIASAARQNGARAVALSIVYPEDDPSLDGELTRLRNLLPEVPLIVGGRAASAYRETLDRIGALVAGDLSMLGTFLDSLRQRG